MVFDPSFPELLLRRRIISRLDGSATEKLRLLEAERESTRTVGRRCRDGWDDICEYSWAQESSKNPGLTAAACGKLPIDSALKRAARTYRTDPSRLAKFPLTTADARKAVHHVERITTYHREARRAQSTPRKRPRSGRLPLPLQSGRRHQRGSALRPIPSREPVGPSSRRRIKGDGRPEQESKRSWAKSSRASLVLAALLKPQPPPAAGGNDNNAKNASAVIRTLTAALHRAPLKNTAGGIDRNAAITYLEERWARLRTARDEIREYRRRGMSKLTAEKTDRMGREQWGLMGSNPSTKYWAFRQLGKDTSAVDWGRMIAPVRVGEKLAARVEASMSTCLNGSGTGERAPPRPHSPVRFTKQIVFPDGPRENGPGFLVAREGQVSAQRLKGKEKHQEKANGRKEKRGKIRY